MPDVRLIDGNALIKQIEETHCKDCNNYNGVMCRACEWMDAMDYIEDAPTVYAVPVKKDGLIFERLLVTGSQDKPYYEIEHIENGKHYIGYSSYNIDVISQYLKDYFGINAVPVKHGKWVDYGSGVGMYCSECKHRIRYRNGIRETTMFSDGEFNFVQYASKNGYYNFCPKCGTKMDGDADGNEND